VPLPQRTARGRARYRRTSQGARAGRAALAEHRDRSGDPLGRDPDRQDVVRLAAGRRRPGPPVQGLGRDRWTRRRQDDAPRHDPAYPDGKRCPASAGGTDRARGQAHERADRHRGEDDSPVAGDRSQNGRVPEGSGRPASLRPPGPRRNQHGRRAAHERDHESRSAPIRSSSRRRRRPAFPRSVPAGSSRT
jgi:hypothetical protein